MSDAKVVIEGNAEIKGSLTCTGTPCGGGGSDFTGERILSLSNSSGEIILPANYTDYDLVTLVADSTAPAGLIPVTLSTATLSENSIAGMRLNGSARGSWSRGNRKLSGFNGYIARLIRVRP